MMDIRINKGQALVIERIALMTLTLHYTHTHKQIHTHTQLSTHSTHLHKIPYEYSRWQCQPNTIHIVTV